MRQSSQHKTLEAHGRLEADARVSNPKLRVREKAGLDGWSFSIKNIGIGLRGNSDRLRKNREENGRDRIGRKKGS